MHYLCSVYGTRPVVGIYHVGAGLGGASPYYALEDVSGVFVVCVKEDDKAEENEKILLRRDDGRESTLVVVGAAKSKRAAWAVASMHFAANSEQAPFLFGKNQ